MAAKKELPLFVRELVAESMPKAGKPFSVKSVFQKTLKHAADAVEARKEVVTP
jgi:hypothetical protein